MSDQIVKINGFSFSVLSTVADEIEGLRAERDQEKGMMEEVATLRDQFAMAALTGYCASGSESGRPLVYLSELAYEQADSMMIAMKRERE